MNTPDIENELRDALRSQGESVHPAERIGAIRARTQGRRAAGVRTSWWSRPWVLAAGTGLVAASVVTGAMVLAGPSTDEPPVAGAAEREVTVYEIGEIGGRQWLYPEQVLTEDTGDPAVDAVRALTEHEPADGDERYTLWDDFCAPGVGLRAVEVGRQVVTVNFAEAGGHTCDLVSQAPRRQQLAWTVQTATGTQLPVQLAVDGRSFDAPIQADPFALSPILIDAPTDGATVTSPVTVTGTSDTFEANVVWEVESDDAGVAKGGSTMGGTMGQREPFEFTVDLPPGDYTLRAYADDMETGDLFAEDTTAFTVE